MDFDFNLILVPATLVFFLLWLLDKLVLKQREKKGRGNENFIIAWAYDFWPVLAVVLFVRSFLYEPFNIPSESMVPTLEVGDFILVNKFNYGVRLPLVHTKIIPVGEPKAGDVAVFRFPENPKQSYIKRVIGLPNDKVEMRNGELFINGQQQQRQSLGTVSTQVMTREGVHPIEMDFYQNTLGEHQFTSYQFSAAQKDQRLSEHFAQDSNITMNQNWSVTVPEGQYLVLGDNRDQSKDSRSWGFVPEENLIGRAFFIWMHKEPGFNLPNFSRSGKID